ncbi:MAG: glycosyltransferase family 4 protein [Pseudomonadota bacterium]
MGRLLFVSHTSTYFLSHRIELAQAARDAGYEVHVCTPNDSPAIDEIRNAGFPVHEVNLTRTTRGPTAELSALFALVRLMRRLQPDLVHSIALKTSIFAVLAVRIARIKKVICTIAGLGYLFVEGSRKNALFVGLLCSVLSVVYRTKSLHVIFQNEADRDLFVSRKILPVKKCSVIPGSGVDQTFYCAPALKPWTLPVVMHASRMLYSKGVQEFLDAAQILCQAGIKARFVLAGGLDLQNPDGVPKSVLMQWVSSGAIEWWGHQEDMVKTIKQSDIMVLATNYREGVPKILIEAASMRRPIVTTDAPGCRDIVRHGRNGYLVPKKDAESLASAIKNLIEQPQLAISFGEAGHRLVEERFAMPIILSATLSLYSRHLEDSIH